MKKYIAITLILVFSKSWSQISIGKTENSGTPVNSSVSVEFGNATGGSKGIVLPWVTSAAAVVGNAPTPPPALGTIIFDSSVQKVMYRRILNNNTIWADLSAGAKTPTSPSLPDSNTDNLSAKVLLGGTPATDTTRGVFVLGDTNKAMILPRVSSISDIINPSAGMMVYVTGTGNGTGTNSNQLAVFNGSEWSFWTQP
ncbi:hypothetical protein [Chryseobacterium foetidum]|uniref:hypothetical protein n=1 Tax=Chryseobacterium foetidum TaxID=2951057 RepID=UPI0021C9C494|nr:hypothetical protein [Chryseobacterium foetidum]